MRATRARARLGGAVAVLLALLLCAAPVRAQDSVPAGHPRSKLQYVFPIAFLVSFALVGAVLIRAALARPDERARLRAATAKVDQALRTLSAEASTGTGPYHTRSPVERRASLDVRLAAPGPLRTPTR
jgi:hypothetical protein